MLPHSKVRTRKVKDDFIRVKSLIAHCQNASTQYEACISGSLEMTGIPTETPVAAIKRSCNSGISATKLVPGELLVIVRKFLFKMNK